MTPQQLQQCVSALVPAATYPGSYTIVSDSSGSASIGLWNNAAGAQPTADQLAAELLVLQLAAAKAAQLAIIAAASLAAQTSGFTSSALGSSHSYPSGAADQSNLTAVVTASLIPGQPSGTTYLFWCSDSSGAGVFAAHTAAQIQQAGLDGMAAIMAAKQKQLTLSQQIEAATTVAAVTAVVWS